MAGYTAPPQLLILLLLLLVPLLLVLGLVLGQHHLFVFVLSRVHISTVRHDHLLPRRIQFLFHQSYHSTLYTLTQ